MHSGKEETLYFLQYFLRIPDEARVNNAALHYYFGTKKALLGLAMEQSLKNMLEDSSEIL